MPPLLLLLVLAQAQVPRPVLTEAALRKLAQAAKGANIVRAHVTEGVALREPWKAEVSFMNCQFDNLVGFHGFNDRVTFAAETRFKAQTYFDGEFKKNAQFTDTIFETVVGFRGNDFRGEVLFLESQFKYTAVFHNVQFHETAWFEEVTSRNLYFVKRTAFHAVANFIGSEVGRLAFHDTSFNDSAYFNDATIRAFEVFDSSFAMPPSFDDTHFTGQVSFAGSEFKQGLDLRFADLSKATWISFENIRLDPRQFRVGWDQLRRRGIHRLDVGHTPGKNERAWFQRLAAMYDIVANAYKAQDNDGDAERVLHELEIRRQETFGGFWHRMYGVFLGYGYAPGRVIKLVIPLILAFSLLLIPHRQTVAAILDGDIKKGTVPQTSVRALARVAHLLFFSTAVLLGIRFKQEWIQPSNTPFLLLVATEWLLGIALYVLFFALVKTSGFAYVKGLLGF